MEFKIVKHGYDKTQVDDYLKKLSKDYEERLSKQKDRIFMLKDALEKAEKFTDKKLLADLASSVERAKVIENSSKNIYEMETKKLALIYDEMENILKNENLSTTNAKENLLFFIKDCKKSLKKNLDKTNNEVNSEQDYPVKKLLAKMMGINNQKSSSIDEQDEYDKLFEEDNFSSAGEVEQTPPTKSEKRSTQKGDFKNFLSQDSHAGTNFESIMFKNKQSANKTKQINLDYSPNETGFDLKAAVNPTEDLEDIMKAFDFYNDNKKKRK